MTLIGILVIWLIGILTVIGYLVGIHLVVVVDDSFGYVLITALPLFAVIASDDIIKTHNKYY